MSATDLAELVVVRDKDALATFTDRDALDRILANVRQRVDEFKGDATTQEGRAEIKAFAFAVTKSKTALAGVGERLAREQKDIPKKIDAGRKHVVDTLDAWRDEVRKPLTDWEKADEDRMRAHEIALDNLKGLATFGIKADEIRGALAQAESASDGPDREEFEDGFKVAKASVLTALRYRLAQCEQSERDQAELARLRAIEAERIAADAERGRVAAEAEAKAQRERDLAAAATRAAQLEREAADRRAAEESKAAADREAMLKAQAEAADRRAADTEARLKREQALQEQAVLEEQKRREDDMEHKRAVNQAAVKALVSVGLAEAFAKIAIQAIAKGLIPRIKITY